MLNLEYITPYCILYEYQRNPQDRLHNYKLVYTIKSFLYSLIVFYINHHNLTHQLLYIEIAINIRDKWWLIKLIA